MLSNRFVEKVLNSKFVLTKNYRYEAVKCRDGSVVIVRLPVKYLGGYIVDCLKHWEEVKRLY